MHQVSQNMFIRNNHCSQKHLLSTYIRSLDAVADAIDREADLRFEIFNKP